MRCFEIVKAMRTNDGLGTLNNNMRCFEIEVNPSLNTDTRC